MLAHMTPIKASIASSVKSMIGMLMFNYARRHEIYKKKIYHHDGWMEIYIYYTLTDWSCRIKGKISSSKSCFIVQYLSTIIFFPGWFSLWIKKNINNFGYYYFGFFTFILLSTNFILSFWVCIALFFLKYIAICTYLY